MKKMRFLLLACIMFLLSGCVVAAYDITINENGAGQFFLTVTRVESDDETDWESSIGEIPNAIIEDITLEKNGKTYIGKRISASFSSIEELNEIFLSLSDDSGDSDEQIGKDDTIKIEAKREGNKVFITSSADPETYEQNQMFLELIDLNFNLKVAGTTTVHNATTVENDTYTWDYSTILREGINFEYSIESNDSTGLNDSTNTNDTTTGPNYLILGTIGAIAITIVALSIACISTVISSKKK